MGAIPSEGAGGDSQSSLFAVNGDRQTNLLSTSGRGTLPRRFGAVVKALQWMPAHGYPAQMDNAETHSPRRNVTGALVVTGSSERQALRSGVAQLVFTDPPYHDDLQYGELSRLFHAWMMRTDHNMEPIEADEAVSNKVRGATTKHYENKVAACLKESRRVLARNGRLVLTFHNKAMEAWEALARALGRARFEVIALAVVAAENAADHSKRGKETFLSDLVIECRPRRRGRHSSQLEVSGATRSAERRNLESAGLALAERVNSGAGDLEKIFKQHIERLKVRTVFIRRGGQ